MENKAISLNKRRKTGRWPTA